MLTVDGFISFQFAVGWISARKISHDKDAADKNNMFLVRGTSVSLSESTECAADSKVSVVACVELAGWLVDLQNGMPLGMKRTSRKIAPNTESRVLSPRSRNKSPWNMYTACTYGPPSTFRRKWRAIITRGYTARSAANSFKKYLTARRIEKLRSINPRAKLQSCAARLYRLFPRSQSFVKLCARGKKKERETR